MTDTITAKTWFVDHTGDPQLWKESPLTSAQTYRLYHFLSDLDQVLDRYPQDYKRLQAISKLLRRLLTQATWLQDVCPTPDPNLGWSVMFLYDEPTYPQTVQLVGWNPSTSSPVHNHATWGVVALLQGQEKNTFWHQDPEGILHKKQELILNPGDILCLTSEAIHQVEAISNQPTFSFNLYGKTNYSQRYEFDPIAQTRQLF
jgi:predicted metal-dependent enzyme (double-stranded beta helix superfamily)